MTSPQHAEDGNLPSALAAFRDAIADLIEERQQLAGRPDCQLCHNETCPPDCNDHPCFGHLTPTQSLYMQLWDAVGAGRTGAAQGGGSRPRSLPTGWIDAQQILDEIDTAAGIWQPAYTGVPPTVGRFRHMAEQNYRPQDVHGLEQKTVALVGWKQEITDLFDPPKVKHFSEPCPACQATTIYRKDAAGEIVRQPALQVIAAQGCTCLKCHAHWGPELYIHLCRVLGFDLPVGVLE